MTDGRRRRVYELTESGRRHAAATAREWRVFSAGVDAIIEDPA